MIFPRRIRRVRLARIAFLTALATTAALVHGAEALTGSPRLVVPIPQVEANERLTWTVPIRFINDTELGLYVDSLMCDVANLDPGESRASRKSTLPLNLFTRLVSSISAGDSGTIQCFVPASAESAQLTFRAYAHSAKGKTYTFGTTSSAVPGPLSRSYPSEFVAAGGRRVEVVFVPARPDTGATPGILVIHGEQTHARGLLSLANRMATQEGVGLAVMLVSQPGFGRSEGSPDWAGAATVQALEVALDKLQRTPGVDPKRIGVWGFSRGATAAALLAAKRPEIRGLVVQSGTYDLWATHRATKLSSLRETIEQEAGTDSVAWRARSPILQAKAIRAQVLVMHGEGDDQVPIDQARAFASALDRRGHTTETGFLPDAGHNLPASAQLPAQKFFERVLRP